ncbi:MAG: DNA repair exonuclease [Candidatus Eisenbacteria bacterium]
MNTFRFIHTADVHLGASFVNRDGAIRKRLIDSIRESFSRAVSIAIEERVHAFLVAGDLFDSPSPTVSDELFVLGEIRRLADADIQFLYATGNHDPLAAGGAGRAIGWPPNAVLFDTAAPRRIEVSGEGTVVGAVTGAGHENGAVGENLAALFPRALGAIPEIALLHASVEGSVTAPDHARYAPCASADFRGKGYVYWALGHIHKAEEMGADPPARYPGSVFGRSRKETGPKGVLLVEAAPGLPPSIEFRPTAPMTWEEMDVDVSGIENVEALRAKFLEEIEGRGFGPGTLLALFPSGESPLVDQVRNRSVREDLEGDLLLDSGIAHLSLRPDRIRGVFDADSARVGPVETMLDLVEGLRSGRGSWDGIAPETLAGFVSRNEEERGAYLRALLEGAEADVVRRMWREDR